MRSESDLGKTVVITGGSGGLGFECARQLAEWKPKWRIILASRDSSRTGEAVDRLKRDTKHPYIHGMSLNLASMSSVRSFVEQYKAKDFPPLYGLVCNAGIQQVQSTARTEDGFELTFGVNHLGHFLLVQLLLPVLQPHARIVVVSSDTHDPAKKTGMPAPRYLHPEDMADPARSDLFLSDFQARRRGQVRYTTSKLCNLLHVYELHRRLNDSGSSLPERNITVNAFNPGMMPGSGLARNYGPVAKFAWSRILPLLRFIRPSIRTTQASGRALARLIADESLHGVSGKYYDGYDEIASSEESYDERKASELWRWSAEAVGSDPNFPG